MTTDHPEAKTAHPDLDDRFRLEFWNGVAWECAAYHGHDRLTWERWTRGLERYVRRDWTCRWRLVGSYLKSEG